MSRKSNGVPLEVRMCRQREYEAQVRAVIVEEKGVTVASVRGVEVSGAVSLPQPKEILRPGTVVRIAVQSGPA